MRAQAETAARQFVRSMSPHATPLLLPALFDAMDAKRPWQIKVGMLECHLVVTVLHAGRCTLTVTPDISITACDYCMAGKLMIVLSASDAAELPADSETRSI